MSSAASIAAAQDSRTAIGVNIIGGVTPSPASQVTMVAGVVPQSNWNNIAPADPNEVEDLLDFKGTTLGTTLHDNFNNPTSLVVAWEGEESYATGNPSIDNGDEQLMDGYLDVDDLQPRSTVTLTGIPYPSYDLFVYVGSDGNDRTVNIDLDNSDPTDAISPLLTTTWFVTNVGGGTFSGPQDYVQATATTPGAAIPSNYILYTGLSSPDLAISANRGVSPGNPNGGIAGFQIVDRSNLLLLRVDTRTGMMYVTVRNDTPVELNGYQITTDNSTLRPQDWTTFGSRGLDVVDTIADADEMPGSSPGEQWEMILATPGRLVESFLLGSTDVDRSFSVSLGQVYDTSAGVDSTLKFEYSLTTGPALQGLVEFFESSLPGDYNDDGSVDTLDYEAWRSDYGSRGVGLRADGNFDNRVDAADYTIWRDNYLTEATSVPESAAAVLLMFTMLPVLRRR